MMLSLRSCILLSAVATGALAFAAAAQPPQKTAAGAGTPPEGAPAAQESPAAFKQPETYLEFAVAGGPLMIPIGLCSVLWLAFLAERLIVTRKSRVLPGPLVQSLKGLANPGNVDASRLEPILDAHPSTAATILRAALKRLGQPRAELELAVNSIAQREIRILRRYIRIFAIIASVAPLLGLLGTVQGMIQAFRVVTVVGLGAGRNLAPGIYVALITTAGGLLVAIPALITYYWLMARVDRYVHEIDNLVVDFVDAHHQPRSEVRP